MGTDARGPNGKSGQGLKDAPTFASGVPGKRRLPLALQGEGRPNMGSQGPARCEMGSLDELLSYRQGAPGRIR